MARSKATRRKSKSAEKDKAAGTEKPAAKDPDAFPWHQVYMLRTVSLVIASVLVLIVWTISRTDRATIETIELPKKETDRTLAAIVLHSNAWFFKLQGPLKPVGELRETFRKFIQSVEFNETTMEPTWKLPRRWKKLPDDTPQNQGQFPRYATIEIPGDDEDPMELSVTMLRLPPTADERFLFQYLFSNINRWRGQLQLGPMQPSDLLNETETMKLSDQVVAILVEIQGVARDSTMPMASPHGSMATSGGPPPSTSAADPTFDVPEEWSESSGNIFSLCAYMVADGDEQVKITVSKLQPSDLLENVNRWRRQIGMEPLDDDAQMNRTLDSIKLGNVSGSYARLTGEEETILAVVAIYEGMAWFIKLYGENQLAEKQREPFEAFVKSFRFKPTDGDSDGD